MKLDFYLCYLAKRNDFESDISATVSTALRRSAPRRRDDCGRHVLHLRSVRRLHQAQLTRGTSRQLQLVEAGAAQGSRRHISV